MAEILTHEEAIATLDELSKGTEAIEVAIDIINSWDWLKSELIRRIEILNMEREDRNIGLSYVNGQLKAYHDVLKLMGVEKNE